MTDPRASRLARCLVRELATERMETRRAMQELRHHADALESREIRGVSGAIHAHANRIEEALKRMAETAQALALITDDEPTNPGVPPK
jgi:hydroxypyruvate isomerase